MAGIGIDPSIRLSFARPVVSHHEGVLTVDWPRRRSVVVMETRSSIRRSEREQRAARGRPLPGRRPARQRKARARPSSTTTHRVETPRRDAELIRLIDAGRTIDLFDRADRTGDGRVAAIAALRSFDGQPPDRPAEVLDLMDVADWHGFAAFARQHLDLRAMLAPDLGVLARSGLGQTMIRMLRSQLREDLGDPGGAVDEVTAGRLDTVSAIRACALNVGRAHLDAVMAMTDGVTNLDDSTAYLCVVRGSVASMLGDPTRASAAFAEAVRLARTDERSCCARCSSARSITCDQDTSDAHWWI